MNAMSYRVPLALMLALTTAGCGYNAIQTKDEAVNSALSQVKVQLQRRADLVPNLVETVKGFAAHETEVFSAVSDARARLAGAVETGTPTQMAEANAALTAPLGRLLAVVEAYPDLKSSQNFLQLQDQLEGTENRIAVARTDYNRIVEDFNSYIRKFPVNLTAKIFGNSTPREYVELTSPGAAEAPTVKF
jgi:LemA protein